MRQNSFVIALITPTIIGEPNSEHKTKTDKIISRRKEIKRKPKLSKNPNECKAVQNSNNSPRSSNHKSKTLLCKKIQYLVQECLKCEKRIKTWIEEI